MGNETLPIKNSTPPPEKFLNTPLSSNISTIPWQHLDEDEFIFATPCILCSLNTLYCRHCLGTPKVIRQGKLIAVAYSLRISVVSEED